MPAKCRQNARAARATCTLSLIALVTVFADTSLAADMDRALIDAVDRGSLLRSSELALERRVEVNARAPWGAPAVVHACQTGRFNMAELCEKFSRNFHASSREWCTYPSGVYSSWGRS
ncbi:MAG: hypothetical protein FJY85_18065 [Deltaproteobacteria bacterium]|nr:hypothetical protein [Deltaproteobacteria bacterium]